MKKINYFFDFLSPFSYFSWKNKGQITQLGHELKYLPMPMGSLFSHLEMKGPGEIKPKREYMLKQCFIYAAKHEIPFIPPKSHPFNPLYALRLATYALDTGKQEEIIDALWDAAWAKGEDISSTEFLKSLLDNLGLNGEEVLDRTFSKEVKLEVKANLKLAKEKGLFGVPSFLVEDELFWGNDTIGLLKEHLNAQLPQWDKALYRQRLGLD